MLPRHARCVLSRLRCNEHSLLLGSYLFRIGRIENPSFSACGHPSQDISDLILDCPATDSLHRSLFGALYLSTASGLDPEELPGFWGFMVFCHAPSLGRSRVRTTTTYSAEFRFLSSTNSDFELTLTIINNMDLLSVLTTPIDSNLSE